MFLIYPTLRRWLLVVLLALPMHCSVAADLVERSVLSGLTGDTNTEKVESS